ncbi:MAG: nucleotide sugar dehydrogenase [Candidatus Saganbacteria bacterium]|nr:nucleotide sugar dehydrogenase [Candidatus Saganbacteria bacterium]
MFRKILDKIKERKANIGIIGLGYVGLPLAIEFAKAGFSVTGFDVDRKKVACIKKKKSYIKYIPDRLVVGVVPTSDFEQLKKMDCIIICVPTPLGKRREPDLSYVINAAEAIARHLKAGQLIVLESTTYPGTTDEEIKPRLEKSGLKVGADFFLAFSPEREDPGNKKHSTSTMPKVVGGCTKKCLKVAQALYDSIVVKTVPVSSTKVAEAAKLLENIYRAVNIALVNELKILFDKMDIDIWEVIAAAKTKPFGFQAFYPGPGLGGHCIPIDPFYLTWKARQYGFATKFIELAGEINTNMPYFVVEKVISALNKVGKPIKGSKVLILGLAYKKDIDDMRESPSLKLIGLLEHNGAKVSYNDPYIRKYKLPGSKKHKNSIAINKKSLQSTDLVLLATDHSIYDYDFITKHARLIVDTRNAFKNSAKINRKIHKA